MGIHPHPSPLPEGEGVRKKVANKNKKHWANVGKEKERGKIREKVRKVFRLSIVCNFLLIFFLGVLIYSLFFSGFLAIEKITVENSGDLSQEKIIDFIEDEIGGKYLGVVAKNNFLLISSNSLEEKTKEKFKKIKKISIEKKFPDKLTVEIEERNLILSLCSKGDCYFIDENGYAYEKANFNLDDVSQNEIIKLIDESGKEISEGEYVLMPSYVDFIVKIEKSIKDDVSMDILNEYRTESRISEEVIVQTKKGWDIYLSSKIPIEKSMRTLKILLNRQIMLKELNDLEYIDLRSDNKVFYRMIGGVTQEEDEIKKEEELAGESVNESSASDEKKE